MGFVGQGRGSGLGSIRPRVLKTAEKGVAMVQAYYVLTKEEAALIYSRLHPNSGAPDYNVSHAVANISDIDTSYLAIDGSNANTTISIGSQALTTTGTIEGKAGLSTNYDVHANAITDGTNFTYVENIKIAYTHSQATTGTPHGNAYLAIDGSNANTAIDIGSENFTTTGTVAGVNVTSGANPGHTHTIALDDLSDVNAPTPADNNALTWDTATSKWIPEAVGGAYARAATLVVAASNSKDTTNADYVCDGTADDEQINAAIAALPAAGGKVLLMEGTFTIAASIGCNKTGLTLAGMGNNTVIKLRNSHNASIKMIYVSADNFYQTVRDLYVDGNKANQTTGTMHGIYTDTWYTQITGCTTTQCRGDGIHGDIGCHNGRVFDNYTNYNTENGILWYGNYSVVSRNVSNNNTSVGISNEGNFNVVANNTSSNNTSYGYDLDGSAGVFFGNTAINNTSYSLMLSGEYWAIVGNTFMETSGTYSLYASGSTENVISNNIFKYERKNVIYLSGCKYNNIEGNHFYDCCNNANNSWDIIHLRNTSTYNVVSGNSSHTDQTNKQRYGIRENNAVDDYNLIHGNIMIQAATANISTQGANTVSADNIAP